VEKYLKALMEEASLTIPHTHILKDLLALLPSHHASLSPLRRGLVFLTRFAVGTRYPGDNATKRQAQAALRWAERVRTVCRALLGLPPRPRKRKKPP
jgi:HEPN domain-containing protein